MYELAKNYLAHSRDLRSLDYYKDFIVTGGSDKVVNIFTYRNGALDLLSRTQVIEKNILSVKINKIGSSDVFVLIGCVEGNVYGLDKNCNPVYLLEHNSSISSIDYINKDTIVTGSWDGKAIVWSLTTKKVIAEYTDHKYAVTVLYNSLNDTVVSGSQDKALNIWSWKDGKKIKRHENAHNDIIRQISQVDEVGFITCSNDETLKLWSSDLDEIQNFLGHTAFVFTVKSVKMGQYFSGSDDRSIKVWKDIKCEQTIQLPGSVWQLTYDQNEDIIVGCSDGCLRIFSKKQDHKAPLAQRQAFEKEVLQAVSKKSGMKEQDIQKLPNISQMNTFIGKKQGEIRVFKNGISPQAYMWQGGTWVKIGDVITQNQQASTGAAQQRKYYPGDKYFDAGEYDYVFDVDDESGCPKTIPYNDGGNPLEAAEKYCMREGMSKAYIEQIRKFLMTNSSRVPRKAIQEQINKVNTAELKCTPSSGNVEFNGIKDPEALFKKVTEFNAQAEGDRLSQKDLKYIQRYTCMQLSLRMAIALKDQSSYYQVKFDTFDIDALRKLLKWPKHLKLPAWDLLRAFLKHYQSEALFSGLSAGHDTISPLCIGLEVENKQAVYALILRTLCNVLIQNTNKNAMLKHGEIVLSAVKENSKNSELQSKSYLYAMAGFLLDFSIAIIEKHLQKPELLVSFAQLLQTRLKMDKDPDNCNLMLQAGANILSKHYETSRKDYEFLLNHLNEGSDVSNDLKILLR